MLLKITAFFRSQLIFNYKILPVINIMLVNRVANPKILHVIDNQYINYNQLKINAFKGITI